MTGRQDAIDRFRNAAATLDAALDRLENVAGRLGTATAERDAVTEQLTALRADRDRLANALAEVQRKYADLKGASETVAGRLDSTIGRVRSVLDE